MNNPFGNTPFGPTYPPSANPVDGPYVPFRDFFRAKLTAKTLVSGQWLYDWTEETFDPSDGTPVDANPARTGTAALSPALELNGAALDLTDPIIVSMRQKGFVGGQMWYEFAAPGGDVVLGGEGPEYRTRCLNGYVILERATISLGVSGLSQTEYVFEKSLGTRCFETSGSGASGSGSGSGGSGGNTPNPPVTSQTIAVVTNVCPIYEGGSGSGTGGFMTGITVEKVLLTLPPGTVVRPVTCVENPDDCCSGSGLVGDCCAGLTPQESTPWGMSGSFGPSGTEAIVNGVAERTDPTGLYYTDVLPAETGTSYATFSMYCSDGQWIASGVVSLSALDGAILNYNIPLELVGGLLVGEIETPDDLGVITVVVIPPCGGGFVPGECVGADDCGGCTPISTEWSFADAAEGSTDFGFVSLLVGVGCQFRSTDFVWELEYNGDAAQWEFRNTVDGRLWITLVDDWDCCGSNEMASDDMEVANMTLNPSFNCCPPPTDCCGFLEDPTAHTFRFTNPLFPMGPYVTLTWNPTYSVWEGFSSYGPPAISCSDLKVAIRCTGDVWEISAIGFTVPAGEYIWHTAESVECSPFHMVASVTSEFGGCGPTVGLVVDEV